MRSAPVAAALVRPCLLALAVCALGALPACDDAPAVKSKPPYLAPSLDSIDFGEVVVGESDKRALYLINKGELPVKLQGATGDLLGGVFSVLPGDDHIEPNADTVVHLIFQPEAAKPYETVITFANDSVNEPEFKLTIKGTGKAPDPCKGVVCNSPPKRLCINSETARVYNPAGKCVAGECQYEPMDESCAQFGCDADTGMCAQDPCKGVTCQRPPNPCFLPQGLCKDGGCTYTVGNGLACDDGNPCTLADSCSDGACRGTPMQCDQPPPPTCIASNMLRRFAAQGTCSNASGACDYHPQDVTCDFGCEAGACKNDPCAGGCDDGNPCTADSCQPGVGCRHQNVDGTSCVAPSGDCPTGVCSAGSCLSKPDVTCSATYSQDLCTDATVAGKCTASGECVVTQAPPQYTCPGCNGLCIKCFIFQYCIPF